MSVIDETLAASRESVAHFHTGHRKLAVGVCMDARIDPAKALGLDAGDAHVIRNAGGLNKITSAEEG